MVEGTETITATISNPSEGSLGTASATADLTDNDIADITIPVIILLGNATVNIEVGSSYTDEGATATDNIDGDITGSIVTGNPVDINTLGTYTVTYNVSDAAGNAATEVTRIVNVVESDLYTVDVNGSITTYTSKDGGSTVALDSSLGEIVVDITNDMTTFKQTSPSGLEVYIVMMNNGEVFTGYKQGVVKDPTTESGLAPGAKVSVDSNMVLFIETPLIDNLVLGGK